MALGVPSSSPAVVIKEVDLTAGIATAASTTGATVGNFRWGPVEQPMLVSTEAELAATFGSPDSDVAVDFHSAAYFLKYAGSLQVVRAVTSAAINAHDANASGANPVVKSRDDFDAQVSTLDGNSHTFIAKYPGEVGNTLKVSVCPAHTASFSGWTYKDKFDIEPGTSSTATAVNASNDEVHVAVVDVDGKFGARGEVLETFAHVSLATNVKNADGSTNFVKDVVNNGSNYVWLAGFDADFTTAGAGTTADSGDDFSLSTPAVTEYDMVTGANSGTLGVSDVATGFDEFEDADTIDVDFLIAPSVATSTDQKTVVNDLVASAKARKDCVVVASPARNDIVGVSDPATMVTNTTATANGFTYSSYLFVDNNFLKVYDKYNDKYIQIPAASSTAGLMAATDANSAPWVSPAGSRRGQYLGVTALAYSPTKAQRDTLYKASVNPIANIPGQGVLLYGDKTHMNRPSAFDRINVRRLFAVLEKAIGDYAKNVIFELNDEFTRAEFVNNVEPLLREVKGRRGITDFKVVCDETNNTASVVDRNEFVASIFIKPARSINYITLNFVAVRTGVDFEEVVGQV